jgi:hypothetical protein
MQFLGFLRFALLCVPLAALAQPFPSKPVRLE